MKKILDITSLIIDCIVEIMYCLTDQVSVAEGFGNIINYNFKKAFNNNTRLILIET